MFFSLTSLTNRNGRIAAVYPKMENHLKKQELVAMLMESPFYFDLLPRERLALLRRHSRRFGTNKQAAQTGLAEPNPTIVEFRPRINSSLKGIAANL